MSRMLLQHTKLPAAVTRKNEKPDEKPNVEA